MTADTVLRKTAAGLATEEVGLLRAVACPLCGRDDAAILFEDINRRERLPVRSSYVRCHGCSLIYLNPVVENPDALYADVYLNEAAHGRPTRGRWRGRYDALLGRAEALFDRSPAVHAAERGAAPGRMLDVGCGNGARLAAYHAAGWEVCGVDPDGEAIRDARAGGFGTFLHGELVEQRLPAGSFDVVRMDNALEHVREPRAVIREIGRVLKPGGRLYLYVPNGDGFTMRLLGRYSINSWIPFHLVLFTPATIRRLLDEEGFDVSVGFNTPLSWLALSCRQLTSRGPFTAQLGLPARMAALCLGPLAWLANGLSMGEELAVKAVRRPS